MSDRELLSEEELVRRIAAAYERLPAPARLNAIEEQLALSLSKKIPRQRCHATWYWWLLGALAAGGAAAWWADGEYFSRPNRAAVPEQQLTDVPPSATEKADTRRDEAVRSPDSDARGGRRSEIYRREAH